MSQRTNRNWRKPPTAESELSRILARSTLAFILIGLLTALIGYGAAAPPQLTGGTLVEALRGGGFNIYFRHAATNWSQSDRLDRADDWLSCKSSKLRQLSDAGRGDATAVGQAMRRLRIPVSEVLASPYCRTVETARLLGLGAVTPSTDVMNLRAAAYFGGRGAIVASAQKLLSTAPQSGGNRVIVAHGNVAREATPVYPGEGEAVVFAPDNNGGFYLIGRLTPEQWSDLARSLAE